MGCGGGLGRWRMPPESISIKQSALRDGTSRGRGKMAAWHFAFLHSCSVSRWKEDAPGCFILLSTLPPTFLYTLLPAILYTLFNTLPYTLPYTLLSAFLYTLFNPLLSAFLYTLLQTLPSTLPLTLPSAQPLTIVCHFINRLFAISMTKKKWRTIGASQISMEFHDYFGCHYFCCCCCCCCGKFWGVSEMDASAIFQKFIGRRSELVNKRASGCGPPSRHDLSVLSKIFITTELINHLRSRPSLATAVNPISELNRPLNGGGFVSGMFRRCGAIYGPFGEMTGCGMLGGGARFPKCDEGSARQHTSI